MYCLIGEYVYLIFRINNVSTINPMDSPIKVKKTLNASTLFAKFQGFCQIHNSFSSVSASETLQGLSTVFAEFSEDAFGNVVEEMQVLILRDRGYSK